MAEYLLSDREFWALPKERREPIVQWLHDEGIADLLITDLVTMPAEGLVTFRCLVPDGEGSIKLNDAQTDAVKELVTVNTATPPPIFGRN